MARRLLLYRGVVPIVTTFGENVDSTGDAIGRELVARGLLASGDEVVFVSVHEDLQRPAANFLKLYRIGE